VVPSANALCPILVQDKRDSAVRVPDLITAFGLKTDVGQAVLLKRSNNWYTEVAFEAAGGNCHSLGLLRGERSLRYLEWKPGHVRTCRAVETVAPGAFCRFNCVLYRPCCR
jgi:hypothetical protein